MRMGYYIMRGKRIIYTENLLEWGKFFEKSDKRIIASTWLTGRVHVSTVFLGLDHNFSFTDGPVLFETMVFGKPIKEKFFDGREAVYKEILFQKRYRTMRMAMDGHKSAINFVISKQVPRFLKHSTRKDRHRNRVYNGYINRLRHLKRKPIS